MLMNPKKVECRSLYFFFRGYNHNEYNSYVYLCIYEEYIRVDRFVNELIVYICNVDSGHLHLMMKCDVNNTHGVYSLEWEFPSECEDDMLRS